MSMVLTLNLEVADLQTGSLTPALLHAHAREKGVPCT
jgi:hypothetical protein